MRVWRVSLAGAVIVALLGGPGGAMLGQDEAALDSYATQVTGTATDVRTISHGQLTSRDGIRVFDVRLEYDIDWSDAQMPSSMRITENILWELDRNSGGAGMSLIGSVRLEGPEGAWTGPAYGLGVDDGDGHEVHDMVMLLSGEGAYDGLSAMFTWENETNPPNQPTYSGYIFEGPLLPMPDPIEPPAE